MGLGDMFGVRTEKLNLSKSYTIEELYDAIKDVDFDAGHPELVKNGLAKVIAFPEIDNNNQVQILGSGKKYTVQRSVQPAGVGKFLVNEALDDLTHGIAGLSGAFGDNKKLCMELVTRTAATINKLGL